MNRSGEPLGPKMAAGPEGFRLWQKNRERTEEGILAGAPFHILESEPGQYDGLLDFRLQHGVWAAGTEMRYAESKTDNGIAFDVLNGLECLRERAGLETPAHGGPLLKGADWMERLGFIAEQDYGIDCVSRVRDEKGRSIRSSSGKSVSPNGSGVSHGKSGSSPGENRISRG